MALWASATRLKRYIIHVNDFELVTVDLLHNFREISWWNLFQLPTYEMIVDTLILGPRMLFLILTYLFVFTHAYTLKLNASS